MNTSILMSISKMRKDFSNFLWDLFYLNPDVEVFECSIGIENEFQNLEKLIETKKEEEVSKSVKTITYYINMLIEKFKYLSSALKLSYLREKFELCIKGIMLEMQIN